MKWNSLFAHSKPYNVCNWTNWPISGGIDSIIFPLKCLFEIFN